MRISEILQHTNEDILGDGFLMKENPIYRNIKNFSIQIGCEYVEAWAQYLLLPFHELNNIVVTKRIPYVPHGRLLHELEQKKPGVFLIDELPMPESYHMHEAAHVIAESFFKDATLATSQEKIVKMILCESFANTADALACLFARTELHRFFLKLNCYMNPDQEDMNTLNLLIQQQGERETFGQVLFGYMHANFFQEDSSAIATMCEKLDPQFRFQTTGVYLKMEGLDGDIMELLNFPFMNVYEGNSTFQQVVEQMLEVLLPSKNGSQNF